MTERSRNLNYDNAGYISGKMVNDLSPKKTALVLVIVLGCFAVLWPNVFYPMLVGSANNRIKPSPIDRTQGCCDVILEKDITTIKLMSELCNTIIQKNDDKPLTSKELISKCQNAVLETCGIDITAVLQEKVRLGHTTKQILEEIRSLNGSLCLKYNFGIAPWKLGVPHRVTVKVSPSSSIRQERPLHLRSEMVHPAFRERGRAIPQSESFAPTRPAQPSRVQAKVVEGRPGPIPGMRPTIGGAGHVVPPSKHGGNSMGLIMPIYTIGIVVFFTYTVMKIVFKKQPEVLYPPIDPDPHFRREVFEADRGHLGSRIPKDGGSSKIGWKERDARDTELDQLRRRLRETEMAMERIVEQMAKVPLKFQDVVANGSVHKQEDEQGSVQVLGMETTASVEGNKKWTRPESPVIPISHSPQPSPEEEAPPQEIFLEGTLPPQSHLLVTDSATEAQPTDLEEDPAVVLAGKMTLSVISLDSTDNGTDDSSNSSKKNDERSSSNVSEDFEKVDFAQLEKQIDDVFNSKHVEQSINIDYPDEKDLEFKNDISKTEESIVQEVLDLEPNNEISHQGDTINIESLSETNINEFKDEQEALDSEIKNEQPSMSEYQKPNEISETKTDERLQENVTIEAKTDQKPEQLEENVVTDQFPEKLEEKLVFEVKNDQQIEIPEEKVALEIESDQQLEKPNEHIIIEAKTNQHPENLEVETGQQLETDQFSDKLKEKLALEIKTDKQLETPEENVTIEAKTDQFSDKLEDKFTLETKTDENFEKLRENIALEIKTDKQLETPEENVTIEAKIDQVSDKLEEKVTLETKTDENSEKLSENIAFEVQQIGNVSLEAELDPQSEKIEDPTIMEAKSEPGTIDPQKPEALTLQPDIRSENQSVETEQPQAINIEINETEKQIAETLALSLNKENPNSSEQIDVETQEEDDDDEELEEEEEEIEVDDEEEMPEFIENTPNNNMQGSDVESEEIVPEEIEYVSDEEVSVEETEEEEIEDDEEEEGVQCN